MKYQLGLILSEVVTYTMCVMVAAGVAFGFYVSSQRDAMVRLAEQSLASIKSTVEVVEKKGELIPCSDDLVAAEVLENDFLDLTIKPMLMKPGDFASGYGVGVYVKSNRLEDGNDTFVTAEQLQTHLSESSVYPVRMSQQSEDEIAYSILVSEAPVCSG